MRPNLYSNNLTAFSASNEKLPIDTVFYVCILTDNISMGPKISLLEFTVIFQMTRFQTVGKTDGLLVIQ